MGTLTTLETSRSLVSLLLLRRCLALTSGFFLTYSGPTRSLCYPNKMYPSTHPSTHDANLMHIHQNLLNPPMGRPGSVLPPTKGLTMLGLPKGLPMGLPMGLPKGLPTGLPKGLLMGSLEMNLSWAYSQLTTTIMTRASRTWRSLMLLIIIELGLVSSHLKCEIR